MRLDWSRLDRVTTLRLTVVGHGNAEFAEPCLRCADNVLRTCERLTLLVDYWDMPTYDSRFRIALQEWAIRNRARLEPIHILTRSSLVRMGVAVGALVLGDVAKTHALRASFDLAIKQLGAPAKPGGSK
jgi:hypothetical protein